MSSRSNLSPSSRSNEFGTDPSSGLSVGVTPLVGFGPGGSSSPSSNSSTTTPPYSAAVEKPDEIQENPSKPMLLSDQQDSKPPVDSFRFVYMVALFLGFTQLIPWNCFSMCQQYFTEYKLNTNTSVNAWYRKDFMSYLANTSMLCNLAFVALNLFSTFSTSNKDDTSTTNSSSHKQASPLGCRARMCGFGRDPRMFYALIVMFVVFLSQACFALPRTDGWPTGFFWYIIVSCAITSLCGGVLASNIFGIFASLPPDYSGGIILGNNICGSLVALVNLLSQISTPNLQLAGLVYFIAALIFILIAFLSFWALPHLKFYRYYAFRAVENPCEENNHVSNGNTGENDATAAADSLKSSDPAVKLVVPAASNVEASRELVVCGLRLPPYHIIIPQIWKHLLAVWCVFFATLAIYPTVQLGVVPREIKNSNSSVLSFLDKYWASLAIFLLFNVVAMIGNFLAWFDWFVKLPCCRPNVYWILSVIRVVVSIFFFLFLCNYLPDTRSLSLPVLFSHDILFIIGAIFFALTSGVFSSLSMMYAPRAVKDPRDAPTAGMIAALSLTFGLFCGAMFSFALKAVVHIGVRDTPAPMNNVTRLF